MKKFNVFLGILLSAFFVFLTIREIDFKRTLEILKSVEFSYLFAAFLTAIPLIISRAERWRVILYPISPGFLDSLAIFMMGVATLYIFPARLGEFTRPILMKKRGESSSYVMATVVFERLLDGMSQILLFIIVILTLDFHPWIRRGGYIITLFYLFVLIMLLLLKINLPMYEKVIKRIFTPFPRIGHSIIQKSRTFVDGLGILEDKKRLILSIFLSILSWTLAIIFVNFLFLSLKLHFTHPYLVAIFIQFIVSLGMVVPAVPGYIGTFHYFCVEGLKLFMVKGDRALAFAIIFHGLNLLMAVIPGFLFFLRELFVVKIPKN